MKQKLYTKDYFIIISLFLLFFFEIIRIYFYSNGNLSTNMIYQEWLLRVFRDISLAVVLFSLMFFGVQEIRSKEFGLKQIVNPLLGIFLSISIFFLNWTIENKLNSLGKMVNDTTYLKRAEVALKNKQLPLVEHEKLSQVYAGSYYRMYGKSIEYVKGGQHFLYKPSQKDITLFQTKVEQEKLVKQMGRNKFLWLILIVFSFLLGILIPNTGIEPIHTPQTFL